MKLTVQVVLDDDTAGDGPTEIREVFTLHRGALSADTLGLQLAAVKDLLGGVQRVLVEAQAAAALAAQAPCPHCATPRRHKDTRAIVVRSLFGTLHLASPRWWHCACRPQPRRTFHPLAVLLPERSTPELGYLQARFAAVTSYGLSATLLGELLPLGRTLHATAVRRHAQAVAQRLEDELGPEQSSFIEGCPRDWAALSRPELPLVVGLDGGYVHSSQQTSRRDGWFEVIAGKAMPTDGAPTCFGFVQTHDTKPKRRLFEVLAAQGMQANQQITFLTDGGEDIRELPRLLNPQAEHLLDWFHVTMRITVMTNMAKSLRTPAADPESTSYPPRDLAADVGRQLERLKWFLWYGNVFRALQSIEDLECQLDEGGEEATFEQVRLAKAVGEFDTYIRANATGSPTTGNATAPGRPSPAPSSSPP
jgi:hypothetical protein